VRASDPDHSYAGARAEYHDGACDGWLQVNDQFSIGYYTQADLAFLGHAGPTWTVCDNCEDDLVPLGASAWPVWQLAAFALL
jgi:phospholipase C